MMAVPLTPAALDLRRRDDRRRLQDYRHRRPSLMVYRGGINSRNNNRTMVASYRRATTAAGTTAVRSP